MHLKRDSWQVYKSGPGSPKRAWLVLGVYDALGKLLKAKDFKLFYNVQQAVFNQRGGMGEEA